MDAGSTIYKHSASRLTVIAHLSGILAIILMLVWLLHYRGGIEYHSDNPDRVFNVIRISAPFVFVTVI
jgi:cytochrome b-561